LETTSKATSRRALASSAAIVARTLSAVPTGTVDLSTTTGLAQVLADGARHRQHVLQVGAAVFVGRRADGDEDQVAVSHARGGVGGEAQAAGGMVGLDHRGQAGLVDRDDPASSPATLAASTSTQTTSWPTSARQVPLTRPT
jgi:hypothetical protein